MSNDLFQICAIRPGWDRMRNLLDLNRFVQFLCALESSEWPLGNSLFVALTSTSLQVFLGHSGGHDTDGNELPRLVYVSREKRPGFNHHKKAGAMNALVRVSAVLTNAPYLLNLDCDHYINNSKAIREAMCFMMDPTVGKKVCYVQFPQRFDGIDRNDRYANHNTVFFDVSEIRSLPPSYVSEVVCYIFAVRKSRNDNMSYKT